MSLAIVESKPQQQRRRHGGFVSIFFQLLDWNRRLAKKKLLPRKLLPPVRAAKSPARRFAADDKMPLAKLLLIDDENQGGFPSAKKTDADLGHGMRPPGLVAKLMGLESMPAVAHERPRNATDSGFLGKEESAGEFHRIDRDLCVEDGVNGKLDSRPQKLQKTGGFMERRPIDGGREKPGASGKKKKVLSSPSKKNKLHKPSPPVKSPRLPSGRLMKAATRILEPGLQSRCRAKPSITFSDSSMLDAKAIDAATTLKGSEKSFTNLVRESSMNVEILGGTMQLAQGGEESQKPQISSSTLGIRNAPCSHCGSAENGFIALAMQDEQIRTRKASFPAQPKTSVHNNPKDLVGRINHQNTNKSKQDGLSTMLWRNQLRQNQSTVLRDKVAFGSKVSSRRQVGRNANKFNCTTGSAFVDRNLSSHRRVKSANEQNNHRRETGNNPLERNIARKRTISTSSIESVDTNHLSCLNTNASRDLNIQKGSGHASSRSVYNGVKSSSSIKNGDDPSFRKDSIVSFTFNSPVRGRSRSSSNNEVEKRNENECLTDIGYDTFLVLDAHSNNLTADGKNTLRGDELSSLLEQKIRELSSMDRDELVARHAWSASSLEDLGTACTSEQNDYDHGSGPSKKNAISSSVNFSNLPIPRADAPPYEEESKFGPAASVLDMDNNQLSPISIFDASFSIESCSVGSINASSAGKLQVELAESCNTTQSTDLDADLLDSATSVDFRRSIIHKIQHLTCISSCDFDTHCDKVGISKSELCEARHFISNAVVLFENFTLEGSAGADISLESFLLDMLQTITDSLESGLKLATSFAGIKEIDQLRELLFDCMIECLDSKYGWSCKSGYMTYFKEPFFSTREQLMGEVFKKISGWVDLTGKYLDDLVSNEMKNSKAEWTECKMEGFDAGTEIESNILQSLVDEMVVDFC